MLKSELVMKKNLPRKKRIIKRETREETRINSSRKVYTQRRKIPHHMRMMIATVTQKMYSLWILKMMHIIMNKKVSYILKQN
jgi:hypothetical protein